MIGDPAKLVIRRPRARQTEAALAPFASRSTSFIVDAMQGRGGLDQRIKPLDPLSRFAGSALTARAGPRDNLAALAALDLIAPGDVLVIAAQGFTRTAVLGDNMARIAKQRGAVAVVTDGAVRDADEIRAIGLPVFAAAITPNSAFPSGPGEVGLPLALGSLTAAELFDVEILERSHHLVELLGAGEIERSLDEVAAREAELQAKIEGGSFDTLLSEEISSSIRYVD